MLPRGAGLLMPISSLPSNYGIGTFGDCAYRFADTLKEARQSYWQVLPVGPTSYGDSPYQSFSAFAGNPYFIDLDILKNEGLLEQQEIDACFWGEDASAVAYDAIFYYRYPLLRKAFERSGHKQEKEFCEFCESGQSWLEDYSLYMACKYYFEQKSWLEWEEDIRFRKPEALTEYRNKLSGDIEFFKFLQYKFFEQWKKLKAYVNEKGISLIGDIPIYVAMDSADVWAYPHLFQLDETTLRPVYVAGVPPDAFSDEGQLWGNPLYNWEQMEKEEFSWWKERMKASAALYDAVRIDHFIGVVQYYAIPGDAENGKTGEWRKGPGKKLIDAINSVVGDTKMIAEDLGIFSPDVKALLKECGYPGMKILEFAFSGDRKNEHMPHNYQPNCVVYGGTHDNETLVGYFNESKREWWELQYIADYMGVTHKEEVVDRVLKTAYESVASVVMFQVQDMLKLGNAARMNTPGTVGNNWRWRILPGQLNHDHVQYLAWLVDVFGRF